MLHSSVRSGNERQSQSDTLYACTGLLHSPVYTMISNTSKPSILSISLLQVLCSYLPNASYLRGGGGKNVSPGILNLGYDLHLFEGEQYLLQ